LVALLSAYLAALERRWPIPTTRRALEIGATWVALTDGHWLDGKSWSEPAADYDVTTGHVFLLVLLWVGVGRAVMRVLHRA
jgi:hypothetical protein